MKLTLALLFIAPLISQAADTSGCTPMRETIQTVLTTGRNELTATLQRAPHAGCWNETQAGVRLSYLFSVKKGAAVPSVSFWTNTNGTEKTAQASVTCIEGGGVHYGKDTSNGHDYQTCTALTLVKAPQDGTVDLEIAPVVEGNWDTEGAGRNTKFRF